MTGYVKFPDEIEDYFAATAGNTATIRVSTGGRITITAVSNPTDWVLDLPVNLDRVAAVTVGETVVPVAELEQKVGSYDVSSIGLLLRGYDVTTNGVQFEVDSQNSVLADANENLKYRGMRVVLKDLRLGPVKGVWYRWDVATAFVADDRVFFNDLPYKALINNTGNLPTGGAPNWVLMTSVTDPDVIPFASGDRITYVRSAVNYEMTSVKDSHTKEPLPDDWDVLTSYLTVGARVLYLGTPYISIQAGNTGNVPISSPTWWQPRYSEYWTTQQYTAELSYGSAKVSYSFVWTLVNDMGEEGPPSDPVPIDVDYGQSISLHGYADFTATHYQDYWKGLLGYRVRYHGFASDTKGGGEFKLVLESAPFGSAAFTGAFGTWFEANPALWNDALVTVDYDLPPPSMKAIAPGQNGMIGGITDGYFAVCEPHRPWTWPEKYRKAIPYKTVGLMPIPGGWLITTVRHSFVVAGPIPEQISLTELAIEQAGVSQQSMCSLGEAGVAYASNDGIVIVQGLGATLASGTLFSRKEWRDRYGDLLSKMRLAYHDGKLVCVFPGTAQSEASDYQGFTIRFDEGAPTYTRLGVNGSGLVVDPLEDQLLVASGTGLGAFETGAVLPLTWQSKEFILAKPENLGAMMVDYTGGPIGVDLHVNGQTVNLVTAAGNSQPLILPAASSRTQIRVRLPGGFKAERISLYFYAPVPGGIDTEWTAATVFPEHWWVLFNGVYYRSIQPANTNNQPDISPLWWTAALDLPYGIPDEPDWNGAAFYSGPVMRRYNGLWYTSLQAINNNHQPDISPTWWELVDSSPTACTVHRVVVASTMRELAGA